MANRRMFSKSITSSSSFLMMPQTSQNLYFHLGMNADDDGFCEHFAIMRMTESKPDDLKILQAKGFVHLFDDKVLVIRDWKENNYLRSDRYTPSKYLELYKKEIKLLQESVETKGFSIGGIPKINQRYTQSRIGKDRIEKESPPSESDVVIFNPKKEKEKWDTNAQKHIRILSWFFDYKGLWDRFDNREKLQITVKRHVKPARAIAKAEWTKSELENAVATLVSNNSKMQDAWTLETLIKMLTK